MIRKKETPQTDSLVQDGSSVSISSQGQKYSVSCGQELSAQAVSETAGAAVTVTESTLDPGGRGLDLLR